MFTPNLDLAGAHPTFRYVRAVAAGLLLVVGTGVWAAPAPGRHLLPGAKPGAGSAAPAAGTAAGALVAWHMRLPAAELNPAEQPAQRTELVPPPQPAPAAPEAAVPAPAADPAPAAAATSTNSPSGWALSIADTWSRPLAFGGQASIDACQATLFDTRHPARDATTWIAGHNWCGYAFWADLPVGTSVVLSGPGGNYTYQIVGRRYVGHQGGSAAGLVHNDLTLQTCRGPGTVYTYADRV